MSKWPTRGNVYSFREVEAMPLEDMPFYRVQINGEYFTVQTSHVCKGEMEKNCPAWEESKWRYIRTTNECISLFHFVGSDEERDRLVDIKDVSDIDVYQEGGQSFWVTPKGSPREY